MKNPASVIIMLCKPNIIYAVGIFKSVREICAPILKNLILEMASCIRMVCARCFSKNKCCKISLSGVLATITVALYLL